MNEPNLDDLSLLVPGKFTLVTLAMKRARQLQAGADVLIDTPSQKPVTIALQEILAEQVRALPMPPTEELEAREQADLLAAIGLAEPTSVSVARRMEEIVFGPEEEAEEGEDYEEDYQEEEEDEAQSMGLHELDEEPLGEREEGHFMPGEDETPDLAADLGLDELDEDADSDDSEEEEEPAFSDDFGDTLAAPSRRSSGDLLGGEEAPAPKTRGRKPAAAKPVDAKPVDAEADEAGASDAEAEAPKRARKTKATD